MTIAELTRAIKSKVRVREAEIKEKAALDYILADLIGRSVGRCYSKEVTMPSINEAYPSLFQSQEDIEQKQLAKDQVSAMRFKMFANSFNKRFNK